MKNLLPYLAYFALVAFAPLVYTSLRTVSRVKLADKTFLKTLTKDHLRTLPTLALVLLPVLAFPAAARPYTCLMHLIFAPMLVLELGHVHLFRTRVGLNTFYSLFVSNARETREYVSQNVTGGQIALLVAVYLAPLFALTRLPTPVFAAPWLQGAAVGAAALLTIPLLVNLLKGADSCKDAYVMNPFVNVLYHYRLFRKNYRKLQQLIAEHAAPPFGTIRSRLAGSDPETYVFVIGESANARHFGCYGYPRETTPFTDALGDAVRRVRGVHAPFAQTIPSLEKVLTFADAEHPSWLYEKGSVIDYFNEAGFETYWYSNQYALDDTALTALTAHATVSRCFNFSGMKRFEKAGLDGDMLPDIRRLLADGARRKAVFIHLIGSHSAYVNRYPDDFHHFEGQVPGRDLAPGKLQMLNAYDDSIRYTDWVVAEIVAALRRAGGRAALLYFSDHGEDIYDSTDERILGHSQLANEPMTAVPFMVWTSPALDAERPDLRTAELREGYALQDAIHTMIDLASLEGPEFDRAKSVFRRNA